MTTIELRFPTNRYHGTAWGRHVNEGVAEWPPALYRLLRALYDAWKRKCSHLADEEMRGLFVALASTLPTFRLPKVVSAHTRSYLSSNTWDLADKSLIFDAFVALAPHATCLVHWVVGLREAQRAVLMELLSALNYLGRSESWIAAELRQADSVGEGCNCFPASETSISGEIVHLACPVPAGEYSGKRPWLEAIAYSSGELLKERLSGPSAMRQVPYILAERDAITTWLPQRVASRGRGISAAVLELHGRVLPRATETIRIAERVRGRLMRQFEERGRPIPALIHGKDNQRRPLKDHNHLFILPRANTEGRIDTVLLFSRALEFNSEEIGAISGIKCLPRFGAANCFKGEADLVRVSPTWMGPKDDLAFRSTARKVVSTTPFVTVRHWRKGRGSVMDFLIGEIQRECRNHGLRQPVQITPTKLAGRFPPIKFRRNRQDEAPRPGYAFRVEFDEPAPVPFSLGYGCHFGLGQFDADWG